MHAVHVGHVLHIVSIACCVGEWSYRNGFGKSVMNCIIMCVSCVCVSVLYYMHCVIS